MPAYNFCIKVSSRTVIKRNNVKSTTHRTQTIKKHNLHPAQIHNKTPISCVSVSTTQSPNQPIPTPRKPITNHSALSSTSPSPEHSPIPPGWSTNTSQPPPYTQSKPWHSGHCSATVQSPRCMSEHAESSRCVYLIVGTVLGAAAAAGGSLGPALQASRATLGYDRCIELVVLAAALRSSRWWSSRARQCHLLQEKCCWCCCCSDDAAVAATPAADGDDM